MTQAVILKRSVEARAFKSGGELTGGCHETLQSFLAGSSTVGLLRTFDIRSSGAQQQYQQHRAPAGKVQRSNFRYEWQAAQRHRRSDFLALQGLRGGRAPVD